MLDLAHNIVEIVVASAKLCCRIRVSRSLHGTMVFKEFEVISHPAALAAIAAIVNVANIRVLEFLLVVVTTLAFSERAIDTLLR